jgi:hypothetical protein
LRGHERERGRRPHLFGGLGEHPASRQESGQTERAQKPGTSQIQNCWHLCLGIASVMRDASWPRRNGFLFPRRQPSQDQPAHPPLPASTQHSPADSCYHPNTQPGFPLFPFCLPCPDWLGLHMLTPCGCQSRCRSLAGRPGTTQLLSITRPAAERPGVGPAHRLSSALANRWCGMLTTPPRLTVQ